MWTVFEVSKVEIIATRNDSLVDCVTNDGDPSGRVLQGSHMCVGVGYKPVSSLKWKGKVVWTRKVWSQLVELIVGL